MLPLFVTTFDFFFFPCVGRDEREECKSLSLTKFSLTFDNKIARKFSFYYFSVCCSLTRLWLFFSLLYSLVSIFDISVIKRCVSRKRREQITKLFEKRRWEGRTCRRQENQNILTRELVNLIDFVSGMILFTLHSRYQHKGMCKSEEKTYKELRSPRQSVSASVISSL